MISKVSSISYYLWFKSHNFILFVYNCILILKMGELKLTNYVIWSKSRVKGKASCVAFKVLDLI